MKQLTGKSNTITQISWHGILLIGFLLFLGSCSNQVDTTLIAEGSLSGTGQEGIEKQNLVITKEVEWTQLVDQMNWVNTESDQFSETRIDFSNYMVIAVFEEVNGKKIDLSVTQDSERILVSIEHIAAGDETAPVLQPYYIVKMPVTELPVVFESDE